MDSYINNVTQSAMGSLSGSGAAAAARSLAAANPRNAGAAAKEFEAMFLSQMLRPMFETIPENNLLGGGQAEKIWKDLLVEEYGKVLAERGGLGISDEINKELLKLQEVSDANAG